MGKANDVMVSSATTIFVRVVRMNSRPYDRQRSPAQVLTLPAAVIHEVGRIAAVG